MTERPEAELARLARSLRESDARRAALEAHLAELAPAEVRARHAAAASEAEASALRDAAAEAQARFEAATSKQRREIAALRADLEAARAKLEGLRSGAAVARAAEEARGDTVEEPDRGPADRNGAAEPDAPDVPDAHKAVVTALRRRLVEAELALEDPSAARPDDAPTGGEPAAGEAEGWLELALILGGEDRPAATLKAVDHAIRARPGWRNALWFGIGVAARAGRAADTERLVAALGALDDATAAELERLAPLARRGGAHVLAREVGERLIAFDGASRTGHATLAIALHELGDESAAAAAAQRAADTGGEQGARAALDYAVHTGRIEGRAELLMRLREPDLDDLLREGQALVRRGEGRAALRLMERAAELAPGDDRVELVRKGALARAGSDDGAEATQ